MNRSHMPLCTAVATLATLAFAPLAAHAADRCANPQGYAEQRACTLGATSPEALRRFIERTRGIYELYFPDYVRPGA